jgi:hypothetical protein
MHGTNVKGLLVSKDFSYTLLDPKDLYDFTGLSTSTIIQQQTVSIGVDWSVIRWHLEGMYGEVDEGADEEGRPTITACFDCSCFTSKLTRGTDHECSQPRPAERYRCRAALVVEYE